MSNNSVCRAVDWATYIAVAVAVKPFAGLNSVGLVVHDAVESRQARALFIVVNEVSVVGGVPPHWGAWGRM